MCIILLGLNSDIRIVDLFVIIDLLNSTLHVTRKPSYA
jgi:hypothetical protein